MFAWWELPADRRAHAGGEVGVDGVERKGGEYLPFYIPRPEMPQIDEGDYPSFMSFLHQEGFTPETKSLPPSALRAHQRVEWGRVRSMPAQLLLKPILVSIDKYVLDGNHRWHACVLRRQEVRAMIIGLPFQEAIGLLFQFPKTYTLATAQKERN